MVFSRLMATTKLIKRPFLTLSLLAALSLSACIGGKEAKPTASNAEINAQINELQPLVEEALVWRDKSAKYYEYLEAKSKTSNLSSKDLNNLYAYARAYLHMRDKVNSFALAYAELVDDPTLEVNYKTAEGVLFMKQIKFSLAAALALYDNYLIGIYPYYSNDKFRRLLIRDTPDLDRELQNLTAGYIDPVNRQRVASAISLVLEEKDRTEYAPMDRETGYLDTLVSQSPSFAYFKENAFSGSAKLGLKALIKRIGDDLNYIGRIFTYLASRAFGNAVGLIEERKGMLLSLPEVEKQSIVDALEPLDVLLEKTPFRLTDKFIPGHWGHVAIWVGNEAQLRDLGVWDHELVKPHQEAIRTGHHIVEALRPGVQINTLEHFLNIDDFLALRRHDMPIEEKRAAILRTFKQIGKDYDFNFDVETDTRIVCSEIAFVVFTDLNWPTEKALGRYTISPDHVALKATNNNPFTPVVMYHDGKRVVDQLELSLQLLLAEKYAEFNELHRGFYHPDSDYIKPKLAVAANLEAAKLVVKKLQ